jgi:type IV pilus assembly protein PilA
MLRRLPQRIVREERGFTLLELLVVILIIGILSAIAIPMFLGHRKRAEDADAKSLAKGLATEMELCFAPEEDFRNCDTPAKLAGTLDVPYGTSPGQTYIVGATKDTFDVTAISKASTDGSNHTFTIHRDIAGPTQQTCTAGSGNNAGGCNDGSW